MHFGMIYPCAKYINSIILLHYFSFLSDAIYNVSNALNSVLLPADFTYIAVKDYG